MRNSVVSVFLLLLFCIVIAFPGYGSRASAKKTHTVLYSSEPSEKLPCIFAMLKQCLSKGINMVEEERTNEEDESAGSLVFEHLTYNIQPESTTLSEHLFDYRNTHISLPKQIVFSPPECFSKA